MEDFASTSTRRSFVLVVTLLRIRSTIHEATTTAKGRRCRMLRLDTPSSRRKEALRSSCCAGHKMPLLLLLLLLHCHLVPKKPSL